METAKGHDRKFLVMLYEFMGEAFFMYLVIVSAVTGSDTWGITGPLALFVMINIFGGVSGGHFNPAVTLGVYVREAKFAENFIFMLLIIASQCAGAIFGMLVSMIVVRIPENGEWTVKMASPLLMPSTTAAEVLAGKDSVKLESVWETIFMEIFGAFVFVLFILFVTGKNTSVSDLGTWGIPAICLNLWALIQVDWYTAASFNPALAIGQSIFQFWWWPTDPSGSMLFYMPWYIIGAAGGGILAGLFYLWYQTLFPERHVEDNHRSIPDKSHGSERIQ